MKFLLLLIIKFYWTIVPKARRRRCLFRVSCSHYVYNITKKEGLYKGLFALKYRFQNCRGNFYIFNSPVDGRKIMILRNHQIIEESEISEQFLFLIKD